MRDAKSTLPGVLVRPEGSVLLRSLLALSLLGAGVYGICDRAGVNLRSSEGEPPPSATSAAVSHDQAARWPDAESDSDEAAALQARYAGLPLEDRIGRATVARQIARDARSEQDFSFLADILREDPCLSLERCTDPPLEMHPRRADFDPAITARLHAPQLAVLRAIESELSASFADPKRRARLHEVLREAERSPNPLVVRFAAGISETAEIATSESKSPATLDSKSPATLESKSPATSDPTSGDSTPSG